MQELKWNPDTCECQFVIIVDGEDVSVKQVLANCENHSGTNKQIFEQAHGDNTYKNKCIAQVCKDHEVEPGEVKWNYDEERGLSLSCEGLTKSKITTSVNKV